MEHVSQVMKQTLDKHLHDAGLFLKKLSKLA